VLIVEDENGEIVRETTRDTEAIAQYKTMRETLVYLTHLHYEDTESIMLDKLAMQVSVASILPSYTYSTYTSCVILD
jgi:exportin-1